MWLLSFIPDSFLHFIVLAILFSGIGLYILGLFANFVPATYPYKEPIRIISTVLIIAGAYFLGGYNTEMDWRQKVKEAEAKVAAAEAKSAEVNTKIKTKIITRTKVVHDRQIIVRRELQQVEKQINAECTLDPIVNKIHNDAAKNPMSVAK